MIRIGAEVKPGDILIGKLLKGESDPTRRNCFVQSSGYGMKLHSDKIVYKEQ
jgi:DNA-directed RNA polymerase beta subunit